MTSTSGDIKAIYDDETHSRCSDKIVTHEVFGYGFLLELQPQSWPQAGLDFFLKNIRWTKIASVIATIPSAMYVCQSMRLKAH